MSDTFYESSSFWGDLWVSFLFPFIILSLAMLFPLIIGKACAKHWKSRGWVIFYIVCFSVFYFFVTEFLFGFSVFQDNIVLIEGKTLLVPLIDTAIFLFLSLITGMVGYQYMRTRQMTTQYYWLYQKTSPFTWKSKS